MTLYREFMWINEEEGFIAFNVKKTIDDSHEYFEYIKFFQPERLNEKTVNDGSDSLAFMVT